MSNNRSVRERMIELYGAECFIEKLHLRKDTERTYTGKAQYMRMKQLTYHHIQMRSKKGKTTVENGALLSLENHMWFHRQSSEDQRRMNGMFQKYKKAVDEGRKNSKELEVVLADDVEVPFEVKAVIFEPYSRAKVKVDTRKAVDEYERGEER